ncbi:cysteine hydrolase family protein [Sphingobacterium sp. HMA12]|uniref:cysteine hydrolase family protein n=1 Tax=Sphingobacterium sp. HMA12 TaxID=2050894 RepID=UPI000CE9D7A3|nr:isochorismatase family cysteine hydrolase [Sphingobacterium sp. HMA12]
MKNDNTALLVMDMQSAILQSLPEAAQLIENTKQVIAKARIEQLPIIYVTVGFSRGMPEISPRNKVFSAVKNMLAALDMQEWMRIHPALAPQDQDIRVVKKRFSAFTGSDLELILRSQQITHLVLTGISTSGVVLSTLREAADKDYQLTVISDCCMDQDGEVHKFLMDRVFPRQAEVVSLANWAV